MRAYLHLIPRNEEKSRMTQILNKDIDLKKGELFHYMKDYYEELDSENKELFNQNGLKIGDYEVQYVEIQENEYWGTLRILHIKLK